jgi:hypothetical protein
VHASGSTLADMAGSTAAVWEHAGAGSMRDYIHRALAKPHGKGGGREYSFCDALRWTLQVAKGMQALHGCRPRPLLHGALSLDCVMLKGGWARSEGAAAARLVP